MIMATFMVQNHNKKIPMIQRDEKMIGLLNTLTEINNDRIEGYERAAKETDHSDLKLLFNKLATQSRTYRSELGREITQLGGTPVEGTTTSGKFYRAWMDVKAALTGRSRKSIIASCEFGEDVALETYKEVLENNDVVIPSNIRQLVVRQKNEIQRAHDSIKALRDTTEE